MHTAAQGSAAPSTLQEDTCGFSQVGFRARGQAALTAEEAAGDAAAVCV